MEKEYSKKLQEHSGAKPRLGELLLADAQIRCLKNSRDVGSALLVIDAEMLKPEELAAGARDPLPFYSKYGFSSTTTNPRRVVETMRAIEREFSQAFVRQSK